MYALVVIDNHLGRLIGRLEAHLSYEQNDDFNDFGRRQYDDDFPDIFVEIEREFMTFNHHCRKLMDHLKGTASEYHIDLQTVPVKVREPRVR